MAWACATMRTGSQVAETTGRDRRPRARAIPPCRMPAARKAAVKRGPSRPRLAAHNHARELCDDLTGRHGRPGRCTRTHSRQRKGQGKRGRSPKRDEEGGGRARTRAYLDGRARCSPPASPCQGHTSSSSTPRAKAERRTLGTSRQPDRGHFRSLVCLPIERKSCWCLVPGAGGESRARRCRAPGSYWWLGEASDGWLALLGGGGRRTGGGPWWVGLPGLVVSKRYR
jgi:hypothetical protein